MIIRELQTVDEFLDALGGHGQFPDDIARRVRAFDRAALRAYISALSEEHDCAGWGDGFADAVWQQMRGGERKIVTDEAIAVVRELYRRAGGWWYSPTWDTGPIFVASTKWETMAELDEQT